MIEIAREAARSEFEFAKKMVDLDPSHRLRLAEAKHHSRCSN
jgi:hypothetical protein